MEAVALRPRPKLRVGLFADRRTQPRWLANAFARVACSECAEITLIGHGDAPPARVSWPWRMYGAFDASVFGSDADPSRELELAAHVPHGRTLALPSRSAPEAGAWRAEVARLDLDVAFALGDVDEDALCGLARFGVWRFCFGEPPSTQCAAPGFREAVEGAPLTSSGLTIRLGNGEGMRAAFQSWSRTYAYSAVRNRDLLVRKTASFALRSLRELHRSGAAWLRRCARIPEASLANDRSARPSAVRSLAGLGARVLRRSLQRMLCVDQWMIGYRFGASQDVPEGDLGEFRRLAPPSDRLWADPFPFYAGGAHYIFFEELPFAAGKGHISMVQVDREGHSSAAVRVLERDYHLSYPFLIVHRGVLYMIPESAQNRTVDLYRCVEFPDRWQLEKTLLQGTACFDATVHRERDRWWMFANVAEDGAHEDDELHLFYADDLLGEWRPHPRNPVKSDVRCARPAGRLYREGEALFRPAQIGVPLYGSGISLNRVLRLSLQDYAEEEVGRIVPPAGDRVLGLHTLNRAGDLSVIDAFVRRARL